MRIEVIVSLTFYFSVNFIVYQYLVKVFDFCHTHTPNRNKKLQGKGHLEVHKFRRSQAASIEKNKNKEALGNYLKISILYFSYLNLYLYLNFHKFTLSIFLSPKTKGASNHVGFSPSHSFK